MEILTELRDLTVKGQRGEYKDGNLSFSNVSFDGSTLLPLDNGQGGQVSVAAFWQLVKSYDAKDGLAAYMQSAAANGVPTVSVGALEELSKYIVGLLSTTSRLRVSSEVQVKRKRVEEWSLENVLAAEVEVSSRKNILLNAQLNLPMDPIISELDKLQPKRLLETKSVLNVGATLAVKPPAASIILIPAGRSATFNMGNIGSFFIDNTYIDPGMPTQARFEPDPRVPHLLRVQRPSEKEPGKPASFYFCNDPSKLTEDQWTRVIAVIVTGQMWQLDSLKRFGKTAAEIFHRIKGFYFRFEVDAMHENVVGWSVNKYNLSKNKRHDDAVIATAFWRDIANVIKAKYATTPMYY